MYFIYRFPHALPHAPGTTKGKGHQENARRSKGSPWGYFLPRCLLAASETQIVGADLACPRPQPLLCRAVVEFAVTEGRTGPQFLPLNSIFFFALWTWVSVGKNEVNLFPWQLQTPLPTERTTIPKMPCIPGHWGS